MKILGISSGFHDAGVTMLHDDKIVFAGHTERYSKEKNDAYLNQEIIDEALRHGKPDIIVFHEKSYLKRLRGLMTRDWQTAFGISQAQWVKKFYPQLKGIPTKSYLHHETHAAAGILTSPFEECAVMVIDAIGEFNTATIWRWSDKGLNILHKVNFPSSFGLFYTAVTHLVGLKPMEDEYILMGMAAYGDKEKAIILKEIMNKQVFNYSEFDTINMQKGLPHGIWEYYDEFTIAMAAQMLIEEKILRYAQRARRLTSSENLVFMGGVALNCVANSRLTEVGFKNIHIMPNPGDAGSSLGAAALELYNQTGQKVNWEGPYLGYNIKGSYPVKKALEALHKNELFGIANGRAEFGPRALGNRSLVCDPRGPDAKDLMNTIKNRQKFRPFAPVILEEHVHEFFEMPHNIDASPYMQYVARCKMPEKFPAIVHEDGTSRVQTVTSEQNPGLYELLTRWYEDTGCPMLLNTSLNIKGQPIVNDEADVKEFEFKYNVKVYTHD